MSGFTIMFQAIQKTIEELKTNDITKIIAGTNPPTIIQNPPQITKFSSTQHINMNISNIKEIPNPNMET